MTLLKRFFLCLVCLILLTGCGLREENDNGFLVFTTKKTQTALQPDDPVPVSEIRCCWLSYLELNPNRLTEESAYRGYLQHLFSPLRELQITDIFVQVRPFADAIYPTAMFDSSAFVAGKRGARLPFDFLALILDEAKQHGFRVHAWINPYRVLSDPKDMNLIGPQTSLGALIRKRPDVLMTTADGVFLQPASSDAQKLILDGVREILQRYPVAGIHIDDYFYPPGSENRDDSFYKSYQSSGGTLTKNDWRRAQITALLRGLYRTVHSFGTDDVFSVSPGGNLQNDRTKHYAEIAEWCREDGCCDWMIPQLYYGFEHESLPFEKTAKQWRRICSNQKIRLIGGLALYKDGKKDLFAGSGKDEWQEHADVIARQIALLRQLGYDGFSLYSAQFVNFQRKACQTLQSVL